MHVPDSSSERTGEILEEVIVQKEVYNLATWNMYLPPDFEFAEEKGTR